MYEPLVGGLFQIVLSSGPSTSAFGGGIGTETIAFLICLPASTFLFHLCLGTSNEIVRSGGLCSASVTAYSAATATATPADKHWSANRPNVVVAIDVVVVVAPVVATLTTNNHGLQIAGYRCLSTDCNCGLLVVPTDVVTAHTQTMVFVGYCL
jgi:hypothetical protein